MIDGECLRNAFNKMTDLENSGYKPLYVQGTVTSKNLGKSFKHAWVELPEEKMVIDPTINLQISIKEYYQAFSPKQLVKLEPFTAAMLVVKGLRFYTKIEVTAAETRIKELDSKMKSKRKTQK